eukprot:SAG11_NODE_1565_length_4673_cov_9.494972_2_plen_151_part_00
MAAGEREDLDIEAEADEAEAEAGEAEADEAEAKEAEADEAVEAAADEAEAEAAAAAAAEAEAEAEAEVEAEAKARLTWLRHEEDVRAVVSIVEGALRLTRQGLNKEGTLHLARPKGEVASVVRAYAVQEGSLRTAKPWRKRKRLFDPGGE